MKNKIRLFLYVLICGSFVAMFSNCMAPKDPATQSPAQPNSVIDSQTNNQKPPENWRYSLETDKMGRGDIKQAWTKSINSISFKFPYEGLQYAQLTLRKHPEYGEDVIISIERGQFLSGMDGNKVLVRFDEVPPVTFFISEPSDHKTTMVFVSDSNKFLVSLKNSKKVLVEASFYQEGSKILEFNAEGLKWEVTEKNKANLNRAN